METLTGFLNSYYSSVIINLSCNKWHVNANIPAEAGWYFITTNTPLNILQQQNIWSETYINSNNQTKLVKNYKIDVRSKRYSSSLQGLWNIEDVYSGLTSNLQQRAREHTFPDSGTGGLALNKYPDLITFEWQFNFFMLSRYKKNCPSQEMVLALGEQIWRSQNGWPILCEK